MNETPCRLTDWRPVDPGAPDPAFARLLGAVEAREHRRRTRIRTTLAVFTLAAFVGGIAGYGRMHESGSERRARLFEAHVGVLSGDGGLR